MFSRGVLTIEDVIAKLSPNVNLLEIVKSHLGSSFSPLNLKQEALKMGKDVYRSIKKSLAIPAQIGQILDMQIKGKNKLIHEITPSKQFVELQNKKIFQIALIVFANIFLIMSSVFMIFANTIQYLMTMGIIGYIISFILWCMFLYSVFHKKRK